MELFKEYPDVMTVQDVQKALRIGRDAVYTLVSEGRLKCIKVGRTIRIPKTFLIDFTQSQCYNSQQV